MVTKELYAASHSLDSPYYLATACFLSEGLVLTSFVSSLGHELKFRALLNFKMVSLSLEKLEMLN